METNHFSHLCYPNICNQSIFWAAKLNREGKERHKASSPHQRSFLKRTLLPSPTKNMALGKRVSHSFLSSFHMLVQTSLLTPEHQSTESSPNFLLITPLQRAFLSLAKTNSILQKSLIEVDKLLTLNPLIFFSMQTVDHLTK